MENLLRKRLTLIKDRARRLRAVYEARLGLRIEDEGPPCTLDEAAPGREHTADAEPFYLIRTEGPSIAPDAEEVADRFVRLAGHPGWPRIDSEEVPSLWGNSTIPKEDICFFDIETTGLAPNVYVFLCGMMYLEGGRFVVDQAFARDYSEEPGILCYLRAMQRRHPRLVTYNGVSFDVPFVKTRMNVFRIYGFDPPDPLDLLGPAKKAFAGVLPNCRLVTIERHLRGSVRARDIPGRDIPDAYHEFVRTGDARAVRRILYHNRMDLLAMAYLVNHFASQSDSEHR